MSKNYINKDIEMVKIDKKNYYGKSFIPENNKYNSALINYTDIQDEIKENKKESSRENDSICKMDII